MIVKEVMKGDVSPVAMFFVLSYKVVLLKYYWNQNTLRLAFLERYLSLPSTVMPSMNKFIWTLTRQRYESSFSKKFCWILRGEGGGPRSVFKRNFPFWKVVLITGDTRMGEVLGRLLSTAKGVNYWDSPLKVLSFQPIFLNLFWPQFCWEKPKVCLRELGSLHSIRWRMMSKMVVVEIFFIADCSKASSSASFASSLFSRLLKFEKISSLFKFRKFPGCSNLENFQVAQI